MLQVSAPAKINLGLEILGRRADGYHEIVTILQEIDLADHLTFQLAEDLHLSCDLLPADDGNLVLRAARLLQDATGSRLGAAIRLEKAIPVAAGLGGGSSDAAATLRALNALWKLNLSVDELSGLARRLGADVPFFLTGGTQLATGVGEILEPIPTPRLWAVLVVSPVDVSDKTHRLYGALCPEDFSSGAVVRDLARAIWRGEPLAGRVLPSGFSRVIEGLAPGVIAAMAALREAQAMPSLCGAGPAVFSLHDEIHEAKSVAERLRAVGFAVRVAQTSGASEQQVLS